MVVEGVADEDRGAEGGARRFDVVVRVVGLSGRPLRRLWGVSNIGVGVVLVLVLVSLAVLVVRVARGVVFAAVARSGTVALVVVRVRPISLRRNMKGNLQAEDGVKDLGVVLAKLILGSLEVR